MLLSYLLLVPIVLIIGVLIRAAILWVGAYIASIEEVTYSKGITCAVAEVIVLSGSSIIFSLLSIDFFFMGGSIGLITPISWILLILRFLLVASLSVWIIKSVFYTTYTKAVITWIVSIIIGVVIYLIMIALFGLAFYM
ncbi:MAG: hypothetical protein DRO76_00210 [Candidatus Altiarchaeales archaeon]|nr:MAG: hypothetical protein DRO76_00210 [Candidatus Altiarchaeales archaeon]